MEPSWEQQRKWRRKQQKAEQRARGEEVSDDSVEPQLLHDRGVGVSDSHGGGKKGKKGKMKGKKKMLDRGMTAQPGELDEERGSIVSGEVDDEAVA